ncbi:hypothetical protein ABZ545_01355 [Streptomyces abikoensis]|uniref:hypothetical protein n=1 Tax=Streptomyces abikoensis TaxID=97398 RepID=UPI0033FED5FA
MEIAVTSTEYVHVPIAATLDGSVVTLTTPPKLAFLTTSGNPAPGDWLTGQWQSGTARLLVGPVGGAITLAAGEYSVWVTWAAAAETPVYRAGTITAY